MDQEALGYDDNPLGIEGFVSHNMFVRNKDLFIQLNKIQSDKKVFLFPHAGGNSAQYLSAIRKINLPVEIHCLQLPGRTFDTGDLIYQDFSLLLSDLLDYFKKLSKSSIFLLGHSMGSLLVYALVKNIEQMTGAVNLKSFGISAIKAPSLHFRKRKISHLSDEKFLKEIESSYSLPDVIKNDQRMLSLVIETLRSDFRIIESFNMNTQFYSNTSKGFLFGGDNDPLASEEDLSEWNEYLNFAAPPQIKNGGHFYIFSHIHELIQTLISAED